MDNKGLEKALMVAFREEVRCSVGYVDDRADVIIKIITKFLIKRFNTAIVQFFLKRY